MRKHYFDGLNSLLRLYYQRLDPVCQGYGLSRAEMDVLLFLANNPGYDTATDIVERRRLSKSNVSAAVAGLERQGYLQRHYAPGNRRTVHLELLSKADPVILAGQQVQADYFSTLFGGFSPEECTAMEAMLMRIFINAQQGMNGGS